MSHDVSFESVYSIQSVLLSPFISVGLILFLLGFYVLLFGMVVYFLLTRQNMINRKLHLGWVIVLFALSVSATLFGAGVILRETALAFHAASTQDLNPLEEWIFVPLKASRSVPEALSGILYVLANCIADSILLYRCFVIWESRKRVIIVPLLVLLATNVMGLIGHIVFYVGMSMVQYELSTRTDTVNVAYSIANTVNTLLLTLMIAGRIWWRTRDARRFMGQEVGRTYKRIILVLVESGFMYSASLIVDQSLIQSASSLGFALNLNGVMSLMVGIAPTLIILRTSLGLTENAVPDSRMISTLRFGDPPAAATNDGQNSAVHGVDLEQGTTSTSDDQEAPKIERSDASSA
uniref:Integral membrane protein n=1 Tax=Moniliophthora roreri TaxID=221103 RepID=A0A0W0FV92_MONRR